MITAGTVRVLHTDAEPTSAVLLAYLVLANLVEGELGHRPATDTQGLGGVSGGERLLTGGLAAGAQGELPQGIDQVPLHGGFSARGAGDQRIERGTPGVHGVSGQGDFFGYVRLVGHGGVPRGG